MGDTESKCVYDELEQPCKICKERGFECGSGQKVRGPKTELKGRASRGNDLPGQLVFNVSNPPSVARTVKPIVTPIPLKDLASKIVDTQPDVNGKPFDVLNCTFTQSPVLEETGRVITDPLSDGDYNVTNGDDIDISDMLFSSDGAVGWFGLGTGIFENWSFPSPNGSTFPEMDIFSKGFAAGVVTLKESTSTRFGELLIGSKFDGRPSPTSARSHILMSSTRQGITAEETEYQRHNAKWQRNLHGSLESLVAKLVTVLTHIQSCR
jgi:hypothetical protein